MAINFTITSQEFLTELFSILRKTEKGHAAIRQALWNIVQDDEVKNAGHCIGSLVNGTTLTLFFSKFEEEGLALRFCDCPSCSMRREAFLNRGDYFPTINQHTDEEIESPFSNPVIYEKDWAKVAQSLVIQKQWEIMYREMENMPRKTWNEAYDQKEMEGGDKWQMIRQDMDTTQLLLAAAPTAPLFALLCQDDKAAIKDGITVYRGKLGVYFVYEGDKKLFSFSGPDTLRQAEEEYREDHPEFYLELSGWVSTTFP